MACIMNRLTLAFFLVTFTIVAALPLDLGPDSDTTNINLFKVDWTFGDPLNQLEVPADGTLFNPNPSANAIQSVCIGSSAASCGFGAEDGTWIAAFNGTNQGCVDMSPPLVLNNGFCCLNMADCALPNQRFVPDSTLVQVFGDTTWNVSVQNNNGNQVIFNHGRALLNRVCMLTNTESCGFGGDGTWIQVYNTTENGCSDVSPPAVLTTISCCENWCPALDEPFALEVRDVEEVAIPATILTLTSHEYGEQTLTIRADGYTFAFDAAHSLISRICVDQDSMSCVFKATDGTAYAASSWSGIGCVDMDSNKLLQHGFCCEDMANCPGLNSPSPGSQYARGAPQPQRGGPFVNADINGNTTVLRLLFEGAPDLVGWENVYADYAGFNVTEYIPWGVGQICMMNDHGICAFAGVDGTVTGLLGGHNSNCVVVAPPTVLVDGICCPSYAQCTAMERARLAGLVDNTTMASFVGAVASSNTTSAVVTSKRTLAARAADVADITIEYFGAGGLYGLDFEEGDYTIFTPSVAWGVVQVCIISPQGFCGFWSADESLGFEVGPVPAGSSSFCYTVGGPYVLAGGICCRASDECASPSRSTKALAVRDTTTTNDTPSSREITFYGDPAVYVEAGGVINSLRIVADGHIQPLITFGQPVVEVCLDGGICQFYIGGTLDLGPGILTGNGGCIGFQPSETLTGVACN